MGRIRVTSGRGQHLKRALKSKTLRDELRDVLTCYDLELLYDDPEANEPTKYVRAEGDEYFYIRFKPFNWPNK